MKDFLSELNSDENEMVLIEKRNGCLVTKTDYYKKDAVKTWIKP